MRLANLSRGVLARHTVLLPLPGREPVEVDVRPLSTTEGVEAHAQALALAKARGLETPRTGDTIYDLCLMAAVLVRGVLDHESPTDKPVPFFDSVEQVMGLDRDRVVYLYEAHVAWQDQCSPRQLHLTEAQYVGLVLHLQSTEEGDLGDPFCSWPRSTLVTCLRTMARQLSLSLALRSLPSSDSEDSPATGSTPSPASAPADPPGDSGGTP